MVNTQPVDSEDVGESPAPKRRRRIPRALKWLAVFGVLAAMAAFVVVQRRSSLEWYVSPPIDVQGRRVHILIPAGWTPPDAATLKQIEASRHAPKGAKLMTLWPPTPGQTPLVQRWLKKLRLMSSDYPRGLISIQVQPDLCRMYNSYSHLGLTVDGDVRVKDNRPNNGDSSYRAVSVQGTHNEALVQYSSFEPKRDRTAMANEICRSMYVK